MPRTLHTITWSNGHLDAAYTWAEMMEIVRVTQWTTLDEVAFRGEMSKRAYLWSGYSIDMGARPQRFFEELQNAGLIKIGGLK